MNFLKTSLLFFFIFTSAISYGQKKSSFGVSLGGNFSSFRAVKIIEPNQSNQVGFKYEAIFGLSGGLIYRKKITRWLFIRPEFNFITKGGSMIYPASNAKIELHYLSLPILFQISPIQNFNFEFGAEPNYLIGWNNTLFKKHPFADSFDLVGVLGLSYFVFDQYEFSVRYGHSFKPFFEFNFTNDIGELIGTERDYAHYLKFSVGYYFNLDFNVYPVSKF